jgi:hypothetical protein
MFTYRTITLPRRGVLLRATRSLGVTAPPGMGHPVVVPGLAPAAAADPHTMRDDSGTLGERLAEARLLSLGRRPMVSMPRVA